MPHSWAAVSKQMWNNQIFHINHCWEISIRNVWFKPQRTETLSENLNEASRNAWTLEASPSYIFNAFPDRVLKLGIWSFARKRPVFYSKDRSQLHIIWIVFSYPCSFFILLWIVVVSVRHLHSWVNIVALGGIFFRLQTVNNSWLAVPFM